MIEIWSIIPTSPTIQCHYQAWLTDLLSDRLYDQRISCLQGCLVEFHWRTLEEILNFLGQEIP